MFMLCAFDRFARSRCAIGRSRSNTSLRNVLSKFNS